MVSSVVAGFRLEYQKKGAYIWAMGHAGWRVRCLLLAQFLARMAFASWELENEKIAEGKWEFNTNLDLTL